MEFRPLPSDSADLNGYTTPQLMAIGDSIFNGTRSLSTTRDLANLSVPALVARGLGIGSFRIPAYPCPVLFDLEDHVRKGVDLSRLLKEILDNAEAWINAGGTWSNTTFFDNIAIAGATYEDLHANTSAKLKVRARAALENLRQSLPKLDWGTVHELYYSINGAFLLNPSGNSELDDLTPLEQVASRKPNRLLINIGSNDGLFESVLTASLTDKNKKRISKIPDHVEALARVLEQHCKGVEHIYFNLLVRPRFLANLAPRTDEELYNAPRSEGYFQEYIGRLGSPSTKFNATTMKKFDETIKGVNQTTKDILIKRLGKRVEIIDLYSWCGDYDRKHGTERSPTWVERGDTKNRLSNYPLSALGGFRQGGFFSLDNMHPTTVGYAYLANYLGQTIEEREGKTYTPFDIQQAFEADSLLQDLPGNWDLLVLLAGMFIDIGQLGTK